MLIVTEKAADYLSESLTQKDEGAPEAIRLVKVEEGFQLILDDPKDGDQVFEKDGQSYLIVSEDVGDALSDATIDVQETPDGKNLTLRTGGAPPPPPPPTPEP